MTDSDGGDRLASIVDRLRRFTIEREWNQFHDPKNLAMALASEAGELVAELRWVSNDASDAHARNKDNRQQVEQEVADVGITLLLFCDRTGIDLLSAIETKISLNEARYPAARSRGRAERPEDE